MAEELVTRSSVAAQAIGAAGNYDFTVLCAGDSTLVVMADLTAGAAADLAVQVNPYESDGATIMPIAMPVVQSVGPTLSGGHSYAYYQFDVTGVNKVRVRLTNNNAGGQTITRASWSLA